MASPDDIFQYLPLRYKTQDEENYIKFLWESFELNYQNGKYQFAFIAYHLLFMTFVYFQIWKIYAVDVDVFRKSTISFEGLDDILADIEERNKKNKEEGEPLEMLYPFSLADILESPVMNFFKLIGCDKGKIGQYKKIVKARNEIAHANGKMVFIASKDIDQKIEEILRLVEEIHSHSSDTTKACFIKFLKNDSDTETREYIDDLDQINEVLIGGNYISPKDIKQMLKFDINMLSARANFPEIQQLFETLTSTFKETDELQAA